MYRRPSLTCWLLLAAGLLFSSAAAADGIAGSSPAKTSDLAAAAVDSASPPKTAPSGGVDAAKLSSQQAKIAAQYKELEKVFLLMAEDCAKTDPKRAALLRHVVKQSQERAINGQLEDLSQLLGNDQLFKASKSQVVVQQDMSKLLELLLSGDRSRQVDNEKARIRQYLARINGLIKTQQGLQNKTAGEDDAKELAKRQGELGEKAGDLAREIQKNEGPVQTANTPDAKPSAGKPDQNKPGDQKQTPADPTDKRPSDALPSDKKPAGKSSDKPESKPGDSTPPADGGQSPSDKAKPGEPTQPGDKQPADKKPSDAKPTDPKPADQQTPAAKPSDVKPSEDSQDSSGKPKKGDSGKTPPNGDPRKTEQPADDDDSSAASPKPSPQDDTPGRKRILAAEEKMQQAQKKLAEAKRKEAVEDQDKAIEELQQAKAELESILRQLREEESERVLALLEARFRNMLRLETEVLESTTSLDKTAADVRDRDFDIESGKVARKQSQVVVEVDKALTLLHQEGSGVAIPEAMEQMRDDMEQVAARLSKSNTGAITQGVEKDIVTALEEMIATLQKAQKDQKDKNKQQPPPGQAGESQDPPLVDQIAELKMLRALQMRINTRHERYSQLVEGEQADKPELLEALDRLAEREERIHRAARNIVAEKNQ